MLVQLQSLEFYEGALDADDFVAGQWVGDRVRREALHEETEGARVAADGVVGAHAGDVYAVAVDVVRVDCEGEIEEHARYVVFVLPEAVEGAAAVYAKDVWLGGDGDGGDGRAAGGGVGGGWGCCEEEEEGEEEGEEHV